MDKLFIPSVSNIASSGLQASLLNPVSGVAFAPTSQQILQDRIEEIKSNQFEINLDNRQIQQQSQQEEIMRPRPNPRVFSGELNQDQMRNELGQYVMDLRTYIGLQPPTSQEIDLSDTSSVISDEEVPLLEERARQNQLVEQHPVIIDLIRYIGQQIDQRIRQNPGGGGGDGDDNRQNVQKWLERAMGVIGFLIGLYKPTDENPPKPTDESKQIVKDILEEAQLISSIEKDTIEQMEQKLPDRCYIQRRKVNGKIITQIKCDSYNKKRVYNLK